MNGRYVLNQFCVLLMLLGAGMVLVAAIFFGVEGLLDHAVNAAARQALFISGGGGILIGLFGWLVSRHSSRHLGRREALLLVAISWVGGAGLAALPAYLWAHLVDGGADHPFHDFINCYFESMSGLTTTGATVLGDIESLPRSLLLWRALTHWLGGLGIVVLFVAVLPSLGVGGKKLFKVETPGPKSEGLQPQIRETARVLWYIYLGLTVIQVIALWLAGMTPFDAICHTFATLATGGFSTKGASIGGYGTAVRLVIIFFMVLAGLNFGLFYQLIRGRVRLVFRDVELRLYLSLLIVGSALVFISVSHQATTADQRGDYDRAVAAQEAGEPASADYPLRSTNGLQPIPPTIGNTLSEAVFTTVSVQTTTGFCTSDFNRWPWLAQAVLILLMFVGGSSGSTSGGFKVIRLWIAFKVMLSEVEHVFRPNVIRPVIVGGGKIDPALKLATIAYVLGIVILFAAGSGLIMLLEQAHGSGCTYTSAATASIATLCTIGPGLDQVGAVEHYGWFWGPSKLVMCVLMALGRLEVFAIIVLFSPRFWRAD